MKMQQWANSQLLHTKGNHVIFNDRAVMFFSADSASHYMHTSSNGEQFITKERNQFVTKGSVSARVKK